MGSVGGKTPIEPKLCSFFSNLGHIEQDQINVYVFYSFITRVIRSEDEHKYRIYNILTEVLSDQGRGVRNN